MRSAADGHINKVFGRTLGVEGRGVRGALLRPFPPPETGEGAAEVKPRGAARVRLKRLRTDPGSEVGQRAAGQGARAGGTDGG